MNLLLTLLIFSLPFGVISRIEIFPSTFLYVHDVLVGIIFIFFIIKLLIEKKMVTINKIMFWLIGFLVVGFVSLLLNFHNLKFNSFLVSLLYSIRYAAYASLIFVIPLAGKNFLKNLNLKLIISGSLFLIFGFIQFFFYSNLRNLVYLGWDEHQFRFFSTFLDPNFAGIFIVLIFLLLVSNILHKMKENKEGKYKILLLLSVVSLIAVYLTHSRSAFISLLAGIFSMLFVFNKTKFIIPIAVVLFILFFVFSDFNAEGMNPLRIVSSEARIASAAQAGAIFLKKPLLGVGFDSFRYVRFTESNRTDIGSIRSNAGAGTDNSYLFVLATTGIVGLAFFVKFWLEIIKPLYSAAKMKKSTILSLTAFSSLIAVFVNSFFINSLFFTLVMTWMFIMIGAALSEVKLTRKNVG